MYNKLKNAGKKYKINLFSVNGKAATNILKMGKQNYFYEAKPKLNVSREFSAYESYISL